ncbi:MAG: biopolymer transporter ExbD [Bacteriovoracia bacterium]
MKRFGHNEHLDTELNIVPIIDCFVMLICFLLFTAAFTQLVFLEAKLTSNTAAAANKSRSELDQFRLVISFEDQGMRLTTTGSSARKLNVALPKQGGEYDFKTLHSHLIGLKTEYPERFSADVEFKQKRESVDYESIMKTIDSVRHLSDDEYSTMRIAQKKASKLELNDTEKEKIVSEEIDKLARSLASNDVAKNTDPKLLFPDIALVGLE